MFSVRTQTRFQTQLNLAVRIDQRTCPIHRQSIPLTVEVHSFGWPRSPPIYSPKMRLPAATACASTRDLDLTIGRSLGTSGMHGEERQDRNRGRMHSVADGPRLHAAIKGVNPVLRASVLQLVALGFSKPERLTQRKSTRLFEGFGCKPLFVVFTVRVRL